MLKNERAIMQSESDPRPAPGSWRNRPGCVPVGVGLVLVALGIPMLVCPGPGIASILLGVSLIGIGLGVKRPA